MELPSASPSDTIVASLNTIADTATSWHAISAGLLRIEQETADVQAGWLMTAFDYGLTRQIGEDRKRRDGFGEKMSLGEHTYPTPIDRVPIEVVELWANTAERVPAPAARARLNHLLFERGHGNKGAHARAAAQAYLTLGIGSWPRLERASSLHWSFDLFRRIGDQDKATEVFPRLVALAEERLGQPVPEPGVALHALEVLVSEDPTNTTLPNLLVRARQMYRDPLITSQTIRLQEQVAKKDVGAREQLRREEVEAYIEHAEHQSQPAVRMVFLEDAAKLATRYGIAELATRATKALQQISIEDLKLGNFSDVITIPEEAIEAHVALFVSQPSLAEALAALAHTTPPTGDLKNNMETTKRLAADSPLMQIFPFKHLGSDGLARYTATSDDERLDERLAQVEVIGLQINGEITARVLLGVLERFSPSEEDLIHVFSMLPHVTASTAHSLARAVLAFGNDDFEASATIATPKIEALARAHLKEVDDLPFRVQRQQTRGQYAQLGVLLGRLRPRLDPSWYRFLWTFLVSPFGPNYRNDLLHGFIDDVTYRNAALVLLSALHLTMVPIFTDPDDPAQPRDESGANTVF